MSDNDPKPTLQRYLQVGREAVLWKLEGLSEYDMRRPLTPTATSLLGIVKHLATVEAGYFGEVFGRPFTEPMPWLEGDDPHGDMWATADETSESVISLYRRVWSHSDATIAALDLEAPGRVSWWGVRGDVTLHRILVHMATETHRHAGQLDILRELIDGAAGHRQDTSNLAEDDPAAWAIHHARVERAARHAAGLDA
jgi:uncharacterized damage-inducible protein DinB